VAAEMNRQITSMALKNEHQARISFNSVGQAIGQGASAGVKSYQETLWGDVRAMMNGAKDAAKSALESRSPSMVFMRIGADVVRGFVKGMNDEKESVRKAAKEALIDSVKKAFDEGINKLKAKLDQARAYAMGWRNQMIGLLNMGSAFAAAQDKDKAEAEALKSLQDAERNLSDARKNFDSAETDAARASAQERVDAALEVMNAAQDGYRKAAEAAAGTWIDEFRTQMTAARNFMNLLAQLKAAGAHEAVVRAVADMGVEAGTVAAHDMINGGPAGTGGLIDEFNTGFVTFDRMATALGVEFANEWADNVGPKMGNLTAAKSLKAFREEFGKDGPGRKRIMKIMDDLAAAAARTVKITVVVEPTGGSGIRIDGARADGGKVWPGGTFLVGEQGPELFQPSNPGTIIPNRDLTMTRVSGSGGTAANSYNITVNAGVGDPAAIGRTVVESIRAYEKRSGKVFQAA
jgi:hypothetical protein